jgi:hypothetical protein
MYIYVYHALWSCADSAHIRRQQVAVKVDRNATLAELVDALCATLGDAPLLPRDHVRLVDLHGYLFVFS